MKSESAKAMTESWCYLPTSRRNTRKAKYFNVESDYCLEVELTPNRVDAASHYGVARDLKASSPAMPQRKTGIGHAGNQHALC